MRSVWMAMIVLGLVGTLGASRAGADPVARSAAANTMIATIADVSPPDSNYTKYLRITGQIQAPSHKFAPRKCRLSRTMDVTAATVGGKIGEVGSSYPTGKSGAFRVEFPMEYASSSSDGTFIDGYVPESGGTATFTVSTGKIKVQRKPGVLQTYTCRPLSLTVQITVPPIPS